MSWVSNLLDRIFPTRVAVRELSRAVQRMHDRLQLIADEANEPPTPTHSVADSGLANQLAEVRLWLEKISSESQNAFAHLNGANAGARNDVVGVGQQVAEAQLWLEKISLETRNAAAHVDGRIVTAVNTLFNERIPQIIEQTHAIAALALGSRANGIDRSRWRAQPQERYRAAKPSDFEDDLQRLAQDFPLVYSAWRERLDTMRKGFRETKTGNAANVADVYSQLFKSFVEIHIRGRVLDVGCGVFGRPYYLAEYPRELISGIEPLEMVEAPDFECVRGIAEYLPWPDNAFSTVINGTALDHSASLAKSLDEVLRVLHSDGVLLLWIGAEPGAPEFNERAPDLSRADQFHLFHFDVAWFEPRVALQWKIIDRMEFPTPTFSHVFYALRPLKSSVSNQ